MITLCDKAREARPEFGDDPRRIHWSIPHLGFTLNSSAAPAFADVVRGPLRLLLSGPASSGACATPADAAGPGGRQILLTDPAGNLIELFQPASRPAAAVSGTKAQPETR